MEDSLAFKQFAHELRSIEADSPYDGDLYLKGVCATAARLVSRCQADGVLRISQTALQPNPPTAMKAPLGSPEPWYEVWGIIAHALQEQYCERLPANINVSRVTFHAQGPMKFADIAKQKGVGICFGSIGINSQMSDGLESEEDAFTCTECNPRDWKQRARNYALVCDLLAELVGTPKAPQQQCDEWVMGEWERGVLSIKAMYADLRDNKPKEWLGDVGSEEGMRSRIAAAYKRAGKEKPSRKSGRPTKSV